MKFGKKKRRIVKNALRRLGERSLNDLLTALPTYPAEQQVGLDQIITKPLFPRSKK